MREARVQLHVQRFRGGLVFKAHRLCVSPRVRVEQLGEVPEVVLRGEGVEVAEENLV